MPALPLIEAARALGERRGTVLRWIAEGAPCARRGSRGRGKSTLVDPLALAAWRRSTTAEQQLLAVAAEVPDIVGDAVYEAFVETTGPHKRGAAEPLADAAYLVTVALLDRLRRDAPDVPEYTSTMQPEKMRVLRLILSDARKVSPNDRET